MEKIPEKSENPAENISGGGNRNNENYRPSQIKIQNSKRDGNKMDN